MLLENIDRPMRYINCLKPCFVLFFLLAPFIIKSQVIGLVEVGTGTQSFDSDIVTHTNIAVGYSLSNKIDIYGGFKLQRRNQTGRITRNNSDIDQSDIKYDLLLFTAARYPLSLYQFKKTRNQWNLGIYPEIKFYYAPFTSDAIKYRDEYDKTKKGMNPHLLYGMGLGIFLGKLGGAYLALKYEYCTSSLFFYNKPPHRDNRKAGFFADGQNLITLSLFFKTSR